MKSLRMIVAAAAFATLAVPAIHATEILPLSSVEKGMRGYGLTVFEGAKVERFDVEILGVLHNIGPRQSLILARVESPAVASSGIIAGMSGSPVYVDGKVIGALAYSWQFAKEPIAGITPIEEMLAIDRRGGEASGAGTKSSITAERMLRALVEGTTAPLFDEMMANLSRSTVGAASGALPIATPLGFSNFHPDTMQRFSAMFENAGFLPVPSGSSSGGNASKGAGSFAPGDAVGAVLLSGDFSLAATGTVTHVDGDKVWGFGHPFLDMGPVDFPMAASEIVAVLPSVARSFKLSNTGPILGSFRQDRAPGVLGQLGARAEMIPVELILNGSGSSETFRFESIRHPQLFPLIVALAADSVVASAQRAAGERTVMLESEIAVEGFKPIRLREGWAGSNARQSIPAYLAVVSSYILSNEFRDARIEKVRLTLHHEDEIRSAKLLQATVVEPNDGIVHPGDTIEVRALIKPFRGEAFTRTLSLRVPQHQKSGPTWLFVGSGAAMNQLEFLLFPPDPRTLGQVIGVVERLQSSSDLVAGLYNQAEGAVVSGSAMPDLPPSVFALLAGDTSNVQRPPLKFAPSARSVETLPWVLEGAVRVMVQVEPAL